MKFCHERKGLFVALPLIFGIASGLAATNAHAVSFKEVKIDAGKVDVNYDLAVNTDDDLKSVVLWCDVSAPVEVDIVDGGFDVNRDGVSDFNDDLYGCGMHSTTGSTPRNYLVDINDGVVDVPGYQYDTITHVPLFTLKQ